jgi:hypothetical protein
VIESEAFPGLRLDVAKMLAGDIAAVVDALTPQRAEQTHGTDDRS